jgi:putative Mn2+ efflux pump MntP
MVACVEAPLTNTKTVDQHGVGWATAIIAGMGLIASAITSGLGHSNTAAHVAANAVSLFGFFQAQAMIGMTAVKLPPIVSAWTQNFDWTMGIIEIGFMQDIFHWYIQATGGTPANLLNRLSEVSVRITKRSVDVSNDVPYVMSRAALYGFDQITPQFIEYSGGGMAPQPLGIYRRSNNDQKATTQNEVVSVSGIERVSFKAKIEHSNFFITGISFFVVFLVGIALGVCAFKWASEFAIKMKWIRGSKFQDFRNGWLTVLKGIMYRLVCWTGFQYISVSC